MIIDIQAKDNFIHDIVFAFLMKIKDKFRSRVLVLVVCILAFNSQWAFGYSNTDISEVEQDRLEVKEYPHKGKEKSEKWYKRGNNTLAVEFDYLYLNEYPNLTERIADIWHQRGENKIASEFDELYLAGHSIAADRMFLKWDKRKDRECALKFEELAYNFDIGSAIEKPFTSVPLLNKWVYRKRFAVAEKYANRLLEIWSSEGDEKINQDLIWKLKLAAKINSEVYYKKLKSREYLQTNFDREGTEAETVRNYWKAFKNIALRYDDDNKSIADYLADKFYIEPTLLDRFDKQKMHNAIEVSLHKLIKKHEIIFSIFHVIALHAKEDPYFRIDIFATDFNNTSNDAGLYSMMLNRVRMICNPLEAKQLFECTLPHECCHQMMNLLYDNENKPYRSDDAKAKEEYLRIIEAIKKFENKSGNPGIEKFKEVFVLYNESYYEIECIVKLPEIIALGYYENTEVQKLLKPLYNYWMKYIMPDIEKYIKERFEINDFVLD